MNCILICAEVVKSTNVSVIAVSRQGRKSLQCIRDPTLGCKNVLAITQKPSGKKNKQATYQENSMHLSFNWREPTRLPCCMHKYSLSSATKIDFMQQQAMESPLSGPLLGHLHCLDSPRFVVYSKIIMKFESAVVYLPWPVTEFICKYHLVAKWYNSYIA